jgi:large subunit ribosomal protein L23
MALFSSKKKSQKSEAKGEEVRIPANQGTVLLRPRITEKASLEQSKNVYVFDVAASATKPEIKAAFLAHYKVAPVRVRVVNTKGAETRNMRTGRRGMTSASRKAYVYLKKGETISIT